MPYSVGLPPSSPVSVSHTLPNLHGYFSLLAWPWRWRHYTPSKCQELHTLWHSVTFQKTWIFSSIGLCAIMRSDVVQKYNQGRLDVKSCQNLENGDWACLWDISWVEPPDVVVSPRSFYWILLLWRLQGTILGLADKLNPPPIKKVLPLFTVDAVKLLVKWCLCSFIICKRRFWNNFEIKCSTSSWWNSILLCAWNHNIWRGYRIGHAQTQQLVSYVTLI
jgi:hypothetical protein